MARVPSASGLLVEKYTLPTKFPPHDHRSHRPREGLPQGHPTAGDPQGIVFNANYLLYFDVAFTELWREAIGPWQEMVERRVDAVVAEANARFRAPARYDDVLQLRARITRLGDTSLTTEIDVVREG